MSVDLAEYWYIARAVNAYYYKDGTEREISVKASENWPVRPHVGQLWSRTPEMDTASSKPHGIMCSVH